MSSDIIDRVPPVIRWILFLPTAIIGSILVTGLWNILGNSSLASQGIIEGSFWYAFQQNVVGSLVAATSFVYIGAMIVPRKQKAVAVILGALVLIFGTVLFTSSILLTPGGQIGWFIVADLSLIVGAVTAAYYIYKEDEKYTK
jgi:membrane protein CcdC involved in cytochrome C biogenesis